VGQRQPGGQRRRRRRVLLQRGYLRRVRHQEGGRGLHPQGVRHPARKTDGALEDARERGDSEAMRRIAARVLVAMVAGMPAVAQPATTAPHDPAAALIVTSDIANFWRAYDRAQRAPTADARVDAYMDLYIRAGSPGLQDWTTSRLMSGWGLVDLLLAKGWSQSRLESGASFTDAERARIARDTAGIGIRMAGMNIDAAVRRRPRFFAAIRANTL